MCYSLKLATENCESLVSSYCTVTKLGIHKVDTFIANSNSYVAIRCSLQATVVITMMKMAKCDHVVQHRMIS